jgi:uncharacterized protein YgiM (DUF1202 family)
MVRLTILLCAGLFIVMWSVPRDSEVKRFGLMTQQAPQPRLAAALAPPQAAEVAITALSNAAFIPAAPVMVAQEPLDLVLRETKAPPQIAPETIGRVLRVTASSLNVREGPGKDYGVVSRLRRDDEVLVVVEAETEGGWALIRIEGDGVEGYVASRLLAE